MPPKGTLAPPSHLGIVVPHNDGHRVRAKINGRNRYGPQRTTEAEAYEDLRQARATNMQDEYAAVLQQLQTQAPVVTPPTTPVVAAPTAAASYMVSLKFDDKGNRQRMYWRVQVDGRSKILHLYSVNPLAGVETGCSNGPPMMQIFCPNDAHMMGPPTYKVGPSTYKSGPSTYKLGRQLISWSRQLIRWSRPTYKLGALTYKLVPSTYKLGPPTYKSGPSTYKLGPSTYKLGLSCYTSGGGQTPAWYCHDCHNQHWDLPQG